MTSAIGVSHGHEWVCLRRSVGSDAEVSSLISALEAGASRLPPAKPGQRAAAAHSDGASLLSAGGLADFLRSSTTAADASPASAEAASVGPSREVEEARQLAAALRYVHAHRKEAALMSASERARAHASGSSSSLGGASAGSADTASDSILGALAGSTRGLLQRGAEALRHLAGGEALNPVRYYQRYLEVGMAADTVHGRRRAWLRPRAVTWRERAGCGRAM